MRWGTAALFVLLLLTDHARSPVRARPVKNTNGAQKHAQLNTSDPHRCLCEAGSEPVEPCTLQSPATCHPCREGFFSSSRDVKKCLACGQCPPGAREVVSCSPTQGTVCESQAMPGPESWFCLGVFTLGCFSGATALSILLLLTQKSLRTMITWLLPGKTSTRRQADYFHAASSCYQNDSVSGTSKAEFKQSRWTSPVLFCLDHIGLGLNPNTHLPDKDPVDIGSTFLTPPPDYGSSCQKQRALHSVYCPSTHPELALDSQGFFKDTFSTEGGTLAHNTVAITVPKLAIPAGHRYLIKGKSHTDIPNWNQYVDIKHGDIIIAPIIECHVEGNVELHEHLTVCAPHCIGSSQNLSAITVYSGDTAKGVRFKQIPHMRHKVSSSGAYYSADDQYVYIHTCDFHLSQFICTIGDRQIALQLQELVFYDHRVRDDSQELRLKVKLCDSRNHIPDLRQAYFEQEDMQLVESCSWQLLELPNNEVTSTSEVSIELKTEQDWEESKFRGMRFPLKMAHRLSDVLDSRNNVLGEFVLSRQGTDTSRFTGNLLLRVTDKIEEFQDRSHTVVTEGPGGAIQRIESRSSSIETKRSCNSTIPISILLDSPTNLTWIVPLVPLPFTFEYISNHLTAASLPPFYRKLGFTEGQIDAFKERYRDDFQELKMQVLLEWHQRRGKTASSSDLLATLSDIGLRKFAEDLQAEAYNST